MWHHGPLSKADPGLAMPRKHGVELERGRPEIVVRILKLLESGPLRPPAFKRIFVDQAEFAVHEYF